MLMFENMQEGKSSKSAYWRYNWPMSAHASQAFSIAQELSETAVRVSKVIA